MNEQDRLRRQDQLPSVAGRMKNRKCDDPAARICGRSCILRPANGSCFSPIIAQSLRFLVSEG